ncbi:MAG: aspartate--tRNA ligase, partial [Bdellovibrionales bacterium]|nr:aspartate--tRNA ligase [Bdellovibrionales bacterium]
MSNGSLLKRSHYCGQLSKSQIDQSVVVVGWVDKRRDHGGLIFIDLRDREGLVQVVLDPNNKELAQAKEARSEFVVAVKGQVRLRPEGMKNDKISSGEIEVLGEYFEILSEASSLPIHIGDEKVSESLRLKYRYLELRSSRLQTYLKTRHRVAQIVRNLLTNEGFLEIETPILYKSTPEGARDYLVPSRVHLGHFYALPQSPQTLKQLLMIGGLDKYFQIARCFRDEDLRADRQPEFSQIDIEMSFVDEEDIIALNEKLLRQLWLEIKSIDVGKIPRLSFQEVMDRFGSD